MRPDLFRGLIVDVPLVDVVTTMLDDTIPLTTSEYDEWGNPAEKAAYHYMLSYSPYDNIQNTSYPDLLVTADLNDNRSPFWMAAKWVARIRARAKPGNLIALKTRLGDTGSPGSGGPRDSFLRERALQLAFIIDRLGLGGAPTPGDGE